MYIYIYFFIYIYIYINIYIYIYIYIQTGMQPTINGSKRTVDKLKADAYSERLGAGVETHFQEI